MAARFNTIKHNVQPKVNPQPSDFEIRSINKPTITNPNQIIVQTTFVTVDPCMRFELMPHATDFKTFEIGKPTFGTGMGRVIASNHPDYSVGDVLFSFKKFDWPTQEIVLFEGDQLKSLRKMDFDLENKNCSALIGCLGMTGLTAYFGLFKRAIPKSGETIAISAVAGSVGNVVAQLAKDMGLRVIGFTSSEEKGECLKELGINNYILYPDKSKKDLVQELNQMCPDGIDIYFDNTGGDISEAVFDVLKEGGRVVMCGQISKYNSSDQTDVFKTPERLKEKKITCEKFFVQEYESDFEEGLNCLVGKLKEGKLKNKETRYEGIDQWATAFVGLFDGDNIGKSIVHLGD
jgi:NADPH-dependent curcumin reductase CurA